MAPSRLAEQEFVAHLYAPLTGPHLATALRQLREVWHNCREQLGMTQAVVEADLTARLPDDLAAAPDGPLAGMQDPEVNFQAIARREHDVLNMSLCMATPVGARRGRRVGSAAPPGWYEFARWWRLLTAGGTGALLGTATLYLAKSPAPIEADVRGALPARDDDAAGWWTRATAVEDLTLWEASPGGDRAARRIVVVARPDGDVRLSGFAWSTGDPALPPLGRYLMHAAKLRYQARVRGDGRELERIRAEVTDRLDRVTGLLRGPAAVPGDELVELAAAEAVVVATLERLRAMSRSVEIARANLAGSLAEPLAADAALGAWLGHQLADDAEYLEAVRERAERLRVISRTRPAPPPRTLLLSEPPPDEPAPPSDDRVEFRLGFGIDVIDYSGRPVPQQAVVQRRLATLTERVLAGVGLRLRDTDRQDAGDGMLVVLPPGQEPHRVLPALLHGWRSELATDNAAHPGDRIRLRLSVAAGLIARSMIGFTGNTVIEVGRLLDSPPLRSAAAERPDADVVALVADRLYADVVGEGYPGLRADEFVPCPVRVKSYQAQAWLWTGAGAGARAGATAGPGQPAPARPAGQDAGPSARSAEPARDPRAVLVIGGRDDQARDAVHGLLRALDLRPVDWDEIVAGTGEPSPFLGEVLGHAFARSQAALVVLTPDDEVMTHPSLHDPDDDPREQGMVGQARQNVLFEAGMAFGLQRDRTLVVEFGRSRPFPGLDGRDVVRFSADTHQHLVGVQRVAQRLRNAGCAVNSDGTDWLDTSRFAGLDAYTRRFDAGRPTLT